MRHSNTCRAASSPAGLRISSVTWCLLFQVRSGSRDSGIACDRPQARSELGSARIVFMLEVDIDLFAIQRPQTREPLGQFGIAVLGAAQARIAKIAGAHYRCR